MLRPAAPGTPPPPFVLCTNRAPSWSVVHKSPIIPTDVLWPLPGEAFQAGEKSLRKNHTDASYRTQTSAILSKFFKFFQIFLGSRSRFIENSSPYGSIGLKVRQVEGVSNQDFTKHRVSLRTLTYVCVIASWGV
jgi:hypothetical protein